MAASLCRTRSLACIESSFACRTDKRERLSWTWRHSRQLSFLRATAAAAAAAAVILPLLVVVGCRAKAEGVADVNWTPQNRKRSAGILLTWGYKNVYPDLDRKNRLPSSMSADAELKGRLALITGASGGIGGACARNLIQHEIDLALTYSTNKTSVEELVAQLRKGYPSVTITIHQVDVSNADETLALCDEVRKLHGKPISILVSNAGRGKRFPQIWDIDVEEFDKTIATNLRASFLLVKGSAEGMRAQRWGRIVFISSIAAYGAGVNGAHYAASKGGQLAMMKNLSTRLAEYGITVNDVAPAMIGDTGMFPSQDAVPGIVETIPLGRLGKPEEVANVVEMFCKTGYCTGQSLVLAGGLNHK